MSINLVKGQKIDLTKGGAGSAGHAGLSNLMVGLGWDEATTGGMFSIDCDASAICCNQNGKAIGGSDPKRSMVYYANLRHPSGAIVHQGDNLTGAGDGDDEQIMVDLNRIPAEIGKVVFVVNIYQARSRGQHFGMIQNAFIRLVDLGTGAELCRFNLSENYNNMTGLIVGEIYRHNGEWKFSAIGQPVQEASRVDDLLAMYV